MTKSKGSLTTNLRNAAESKISETLESWATSSFGRAIQTRMGKRPLMDAAHRAVRFALEQAGFVWEVRSRGDLKLGLWRKKLTFRKEADPARRIVFVPGFGDTPVSWISVFALLTPALTKEYDELILVNLPGYAGFLSRDPAFSSMDLLLSTFEDLIRDLKPHTLMGHSLGGWMCAHAATAKTILVKPKKLILISPSGVFGSQENRDALKNVFDEAVKVGFEAIRSRVFRVEPFWLSFFISESNHFFADPEIIMFLDSVREDHAIDDNLAELTSDTWVYWGESDGLVPPQMLQVWQEKMHALGKPFHGALIRNSGHSPHIERPAVTAAVLTEAILGKQSPELLSKRFWIPTSAYLPSE